MKRILLLFTSKENALINELKINSAVEKLFTTNQDVIANRFVK